MPSAQILCRTAGGEHLACLVAALAAKTAAKILVEIVEIACDFLVRNVSFDPAGGGTRVDARGFAFGADNGIVDRDGDGVETFFAEIENDFTFVAGLANGQEGNLA
jgi:hypothetical protein